MPIPCLIAPSSEDVGIDLMVIAGAGNQHFAMLLEVHQPVGHLEIAHVEDRAVMLEGRGVFAVRIDHDHMALRRRFADAVQDQCGGGLLARARRTQQREVRAQQRVDIEPGADVARGKHRAHFDIGASIARENENGS